MPSGRDGDMAQAHAMIACVDQGSPIFKMLPASGTLAAGSLS
jgi:hypothetical protein